MPPSDTTSCEVHIFFVLDVTEGWLVGWQKTERTAVVGQPWGAPAGNADNFCTREPGLSSKPTYREIPEIRALAVRDFPTAMHTTNQTTVFVLAYHT